MRIRFLLAPAVLMLAGAVTTSEARGPEDAVALARSGTTAIENQRFGEALKAFTRAASLQPDDASHCFGAGVAAFMLGRNDVARARFECALAIKPSHLQAAIWLGDLHYRAGHLREAIATYDTARQFSPGASELQEKLALWRPELELQSRFLEVRTDRFTVLFEAASDEPLARAAVARLEAAYERVGHTLGVRPSHPITVVLYTREQFADITKLAAWSVAAYDGRIRVPISGALAEPEELDRVLSHEFVHAVVATLGGRTVPAWVNEGLATVLEPAGPRDAEATLEGSDARPALSTLHRGFVDLSRRDAEVAYGWAARAVRRLLEQHGPAAVVSMLKDLAKGESFTSAFEQRIAMRYEDFSALVARD